MSSAVFSGFAPGVPRTVKLPAAFFSDLLPLIDDLAELKITLFAFYAIQQREGAFRYFTRADFASDSALMAGLHSAAPDRAPDEALDAALSAAHARGTLLRAEVGAETRWFINAEPGRRAVEQIARGEWQRDDGAAVELLPERPSIFQLYEENIGALTPMIVDALKDAASEYSDAWVEDAIRIAVENNARSWRYIAAVLERRRKEGQRHEAPQEFDPLNGKTYLNSDYAAFIRT